MELVLEHPERNEKMNFDTENLEVSDLEKVYKPIVSKSELTKKIDNLNISAEGKMYLASIAEVSLKIGDKLLSIGRKAVELIIHFCKSYPNTAVGLVIGATASFLISSIPVIGWLIGWLVTPLLTLLGLGIGVWMDMKQQNLKSKIKNDTMELFGSLQNLQPAVK